MFELSIRQVRPATGRSVPQADAGSGQAELPGAAVTAGTVVAATAAVAAAATGEYAARAEDADEERCHGDEHEHRFGGGEHKREDEDHGGERASERSAGTLRRVAGALDVGEVVGFVHTGSYRGATRINII